MLNRNIKKIFDYEGLYGLCKKRGDIIFLQFENAKLSCKYVLTVWIVNSRDDKGQIISECPYEIIVSSIRPTKKFPRFLP